MAIDQLEPVTVFRSLFWSSCLKSSIIKLAEKRKNILHRTHVLAEPNLKHSFDKIIQRQAPVCEILFHSVVQVIWLAFKVLLAWAPLHRVISSHRPLVEFVIFAPSFISLPSFYQLDVPLIVLQPAAKQVRAEGDDGGVDGILGNMI